MSSALRITEIFFSLQGEARTVGLPTVFVRLTGCPLRCSYCDTAYAFSGGKVIAIDEIVATIGQYPTQYVTITGGEPLAQTRVLELMTRLCDLGKKVSLETSGALSVAQVDARVSKVVDFKTPSSNETGRNLYDNVQWLHAHDQVKFVIGNRQDYQWSALKVDELGLRDKVDDILFSPVFGELEPAQLAQWIIEDGLVVRLQVQLHKILWGEQQGV